MAWEDFLTVQEVQSAALDSSSAVNDDFYAVEQAIRDVQDMIVSYLDRDFFIHRTKQGIRYEDWKVDRTTDPLKYRVWADHWPLVEIQSPSEVSIRRDNRQFQRDTKKVTEVDYHAGWKRSDQSLGDLDGTNSGTLTALTTAPSDLPKAIRRVGIKLVLFEMSEAEHGAGIGRVEQAVGAQGTMTVSGVDSGYVDRQLSKLDRYKTSLY